MKDKATHKKKERPTASSPKRVRGERSAKREAHPVASRVRERRADGRDARGSRADAGRNPGPSDDSAATPFLIVRRARQNNLRNIDAAIPLGRFVCVTGVSGSGKSSLVNDILCEALARDLNGATTSAPGEHDAIEGLEHLDKIINVDQSPIGRTPRSNPATYIKLFDAIRDLYAKLPESRLRGYAKGRFSFNVPVGERGGGRCESCEGNGANRLEMDFLADVWVTCPACQGRRFSQETLQIRFKEKSIADVLEMDVQEALTHFSEIPDIRGPLQTLHDVGLDYIKLGQPSPTLSGGEAQRIKLAKELARKATGRTLYVLDEPTTGLHFDDVARLLDVLQRLVNAGNSVLVVEHHLDVIKTADWIIDLGPEGGGAGGNIVVEGTPEQAARCAASHTGRALEELFQRERQGQARDKENTAAPSIREKREDPKAAVANANRNGQPAGGRTGGPVSAHPKSIHVVGAHEHNLRHVNADIPQNQLSVFCGPSGSGKSSLAIDTLYTEGQRRYIESLSSYARQFLGQMKKPLFERMENLQPAICIEQKTAGRSPRSTVGTMTEIYDHMRVLWARLAVTHCPQCRDPVIPQTVDEILDAVLTMGEGRKILILAPIQPEKNESVDDLLERERRQGYVRARINGQIIELSAALEAGDQTIRSPMGRKSGPRAPNPLVTKVELVIDRAVVRGNQRARLSDSIEHALARGRGFIMIHDVDADKDRFFARHRVCLRCAVTYEELTPHHFSFNSRLGWCPTCEGLGVQVGADPAMILVNPARSLLDGAIAGWRKIERTSPLARLLGGLAGRLGFTLEQPVNSLTEPQRLALLYGHEDDTIEPLPEAGQVDEEGVARNGVDPLAGVRFRWRGFFPAIARAMRINPQLRASSDQHVAEIPCESCLGSRLAPLPMHARLGGATIHEVAAMTLQGALNWFRALKLDKRQKKIAGELLREIEARLSFLLEIGLDYLMLQRPAPSLSGGESQRIRLAAQLGTGLTGALYVLDEPTIGLHPRDNDRLIAALKKLRDLGNTLIVVEHDREVIAQSDQMFDFGPGSGPLGGTITARGTPQALSREADSLTSRYLSGKAAIPVPSERRPVDPPGGKDARGGEDPPRLVVVGARQNNLRDIDVSFPLGRFVCITGVSGSGKSTLINDTLYPDLARRFHGTLLPVGVFERIEGTLHLNKVINVDQSPIGVSPNSTPATYIGAFDLIRELFARLPEAKMRGHSAGRFSFNIAGGRCEVCEGLGKRRIEMHFLPDLWIDCEACGGLRYTRETLEIRYRGKSIADVLQLAVDEAVALFEAIPRIKRMLGLLQDVGLGYLPLGQPAPTLSGGEAQRIKLARELIRPATGRTLYIFDEPTTGLHFDDIRKLLDVLHRLVDLGNTVICVEHNLDVIKTSDWIIDLGPEAGAGGGAIVAEGTPEAIAACTASHTGRYLAQTLKAGPIEPRKFFTEDEQRRLDAELRKPIKLDTHSKAPWEVNGRRWHFEERPTAGGKRVLWDPALLKWLVETIEEAGDFAPADFANRSRIEITGKDSSLSWFCHLLTGGKNHIDVNFRVPAKAFSAADLANRLAIKPLDDREDLPIYGSHPRLQLRRAGPGWINVRLTPVDFKDVNQRAWKAFFEEAAEAYLSAEAKAVSASQGHSARTTKRNNGRTKDDGRANSAWDKLKGLPALLKAAISGDEDHWQSRGLLWMLTQLDKIGEGIEYRPRGAGPISIRHKKTGHELARLYTKSSKGLKLEVMATPSLRAQVNKRPVGKEVAFIKRPDRTVIQITFKSAEDMDLKAFSDFWREGVLAESTKGSQESE